MKEKGKESGEIKKMNLITSRQLDSNEKQVIYELTLKKRQSKKSTMSERQVAAREQLAKELKLVRIFPQTLTLDNPYSSRQVISLHHREHDNNNDIDDDDDSSITNPPNKATDSSSYNNKFIISALHRTIHNNNNNQSDNDEKATIISDDQPSIASGSIETTTTSGISCCGTSTSISISNSFVGDCLIRTATANNLNSKTTLPESSNSTSTSSELNQKLLQYQSAHGSSPAGSSCGCSFGRSDSSYSGSSQNSSGSARLKGDYSGKHEDELQAFRKEANIKFYKTKLEHLNEELERKLYEYEYLVTKEKSILGTYNMVLFTSEGVNNFY